MAICGKGVPTPDLPGQWALGFWNSGSVLLFGSVGVVVVVVRLWFPVQLEITALSSSHASTA